MKIISYTLLLAALLFSALNSFSQKSKLVSVKVESTDLATQTLVAVECSQFEKMFTTTTARHSITSSSDLALLEETTKHFILSNGEDKIDVRGTVTFRYRRVAIKYCFDRYGLFYGKGRYFKNQLLLNIILKKIDFEK
ncbi:hypothetical protein [Pedobacter jamesrossensis]|uniref:Tissue inhibitor of metalloproteinase n=1 Tax=Pedobacter jamesrossensis TaxID=1908238 RepID=A0ABV8NGZ6_9SPHI